MTPELTSVTGTQGGVFLRSQALECGHSKREIEALLRRGVWQRVRWGTYAETRHVENLGSSARYELLVRAVMLRMTPPALATHNSAAVLHGLPLWGTDMSVVHITRPDSHSGRRQAGVNHHEARIAAADRADIQGVACSSLRRTAVDVAREFGFAPGVVAMDAALRAGVEPADVMSLAESMRDWPRSPQVFRAVRFADAGAESPGESLARMFLVSIGFPAPETQVVIEAQGFAARVDLLIPQVNWVFEFDGRVKYRRQRDTLDPVVDDADVVWAEKQREDVLRELGFEVSRLVWADLFGQQRQVRAAQLHAKARRLGAPGRWHRAA